MSKRKRFFPPEVIERALAAKMWPNDAEAETVKDYLKALLKKLLDDEEEFNGKRPFGNSSWMFDIYRALIAAEVVKGSFDEDGYVDNVDEGYAQVLLQACVDSL